MKNPRTGSAGKSGELLTAAFRITLVLKGVDGLLEMVGGVLLLVVTPDQISSLVRTLTQHELSVDSGDLLTNAVRHAADSLTVSASAFAAVYLLLHGLVKIVLVWAVLKDYLWAYPWMIAFLLIFIGFQCYQIAVSFSWALVVLTLFDILVVWLTWREYGVQRNRTAGSRP